MALTLGFTSMDQATETALRAAFTDANSQLQEHFTLAPTDAADYVVIDMDSMYGPMGWLRLHAAGKQVIGLTSAARTQADFRIGRPFDTEAMLDLLRQVAASAGVDLGAAPAAPAATPPVQAAPEAEAPVGDAAVTAHVAAQTEPESEPPAAGEPAAGVIAGDEIAAAPEPEEQPPMPDPVVEKAPEPEPKPEPESESEPEPQLQPEPEPEPPPPPRDPVFADWMQPGALQGRFRFRRGDGPELWIDAGARQYHGPQQLKPLAGYFEGTVEQADFEAMDADAWSAGTAAAGEAQPLSRLQWLGGLLAGSGALLPGTDPEGRYRLTKWPQTEREYPRHFRIATAMMKGPATLAEIAEASGSPLAEVADFTNANLTTGFAEFVPEPEPEPEAPAKPTGFFGRLRGKY